MGGGGGVRERRRGRGIFFVQLSCLKKEKGVKYQHLFEQILG